MAAGVPKASVCCLGPEVPEHDFGAAGLEASRARWAVSGAERDLRTSSISIPGLVPGLRYLTGLGSGVRPPSTREEKIGLSLSLVLLRRRDFGFGLFAGLARKYQVLEGNLRTSMLGSLPKDSFVTHVMRLVTVKKSQSPQTQCRVGRAVSQSLGACQSVAHRAGSGCT